MRLDGAVRYATDNPGHGLVLQMAGLLPFTLGLAALAIALLRAGTVPRPVPVLLLVLLAAQFSPVPARILDLLQVVLMGTLIGIAAKYVSAAR